MELKEKKDRRGDEKSEIPASLDGQQLEEKEEMAGTAEEADAIKKMDVTELPEIPSKDDSQEAERLLQQQQVALAFYVY
jgi:hypothetical protein